MSRMRTVQEIRKCFCIFRPSSFAGHSCHDMRIEQHPGFLDSLNRSYRLFLIMILFHEHKYIIQPINFKTSSSPLSIPR